MPKPSSGRRKKVAVVQFEKAKTIEEANKLAVQYGLAENADFRELDIRAANEIIETLKKTKDEMPNAFDKLDFLGGNIEYERYKKELGASLGIRFKKTEMGDASGAVASYYLNGKYHRSMIYNSKVFNPKNYPSSFELRKNFNEIYSWHPVGCNTLKSTADHEIGHLIDKKFSISEHSQVIRNLYDKYYVKTTTSSPINPKMARVLSSYANTNIREFIAEAWSEYRNNPKPREVAKAIGDEIAKYIKGK